MEKKVCSKCKLEKEISSFGKDSSRKNGISYLCKECLIRKSKKYKEENKHKVLDSYAEYRVKNKEKMKIARVEYRKRNKEKITEYRRYYSDKRRKESDIVRLSENIRRRINHFFNYKNVKKSKGTFDILCCSLDELLLHLESQFKEGMSWDNHGRHGWHIDHIIPLSSAKTEEEVYKLCHYTNLQPLWAHENLSKGNRILREL